MDLEAYYRELIAKLPVVNGELYIEGLYRSPELDQVDPTPETASASKKVWRGKSLHSRTAFRPGDVIFCERKMSGQVEGVSARYTKTCEYCMRCLGSLEQQFTAMSVPAKSASRKTVESTFQVYPALKQVNGSLSEEPYAILAKEMYEQGAVSKEPLTRAEEALPYKGQALAFAAARIDHDRKELAAMNGDCSSDHEVPAADSKSQWPLPDEALEVPVYLCRYGSGAVFCSRECNERAYQEWLQVFVPRTTQKTLHAADSTNNEFKSFATPEVPETKDTSTPDIAQVAAELKRFASTTNPLLLLAVKVIANVAIQWRQSILSTSKPIPKEEASSLCVKYLTPVLVYSQVPWWLQANPAQTHAAPGQATLGEADHAPSGQNEIHGTNAASVGGFRAHVFEIISETTKLAYIILRAYLADVFDLVEGLSAPPPQYKGVEDMGSDGLPNQICGFPVRKITPNLTPSGAPEKDSIQALRLASFVNNVDMRIRHARANYVTPLDMVNELSLGMIMGAFELNNIGMTSRPLVQDYVEFLGEVDRETLRDYYTIIKKIYKALPPELLSRATGPISGEDHKDDEADEGEEAVEDDQDAAEGRQPLPGEPESKSETEAKHSSTSSRCEDPECTHEHSHDVHTHDHGHEHDGTCSDDDCEDGEDESSLEEPIVAGSSASEDASTGDISVKMEFSGDSPFKDLLSKIKPPKPFDSNPGLWAALWCANPLPVATFKEFCQELKRRRMQVIEKLGPAAWRSAVNRAAKHPEGAGLYAIGCCMNHSCAPNVAVMKQGDGRDDLSCFIAIRPIKPGDELFISYIEGEEDMKRTERRNLLADYMFLCECVRCSPPSLVPGAQSQSKAGTTSSTKSKPAGASAAKGATSTKPLASTTAPKPKAKLASGAKPAGRK